MTTPLPASSAPAAPGPSGDLPVIAAGTLRRLALDEDLAAAVAADPRLTALLWRVARRYVAGETLDSAAPRIARAVAAGHHVTVDHMGESTRDAGDAERATEEFVHLAGEVADGRLSCSVSLDLSHVGSVVDRELGRRNAGRIAEATARAGCEMIVSMEGFDRVDQILEDHEHLCARFDHVGIRVQARLHRTAQDLPRLLDRPGRIGLVKGAYETPPGVALERHDPALGGVYDAAAALLLRNGHACSLATHDPDRIAAALRLIEAEEIPGGAYRFEMLAGIAGAALDELRDRGHPTQLYVVYGRQWWLYVCNRLAEDPQRVLQALVDVAAQPPGSGGS